MSQEEKSYNSDSIKVLKGLEAVRKRPGMYIGDTDDGSGLHHMVYEVVDNSIDESLAGYCKNIFVKLYADGSASVRDDGRGIPVDIHPEENVSAAEVVMTVLHAGGKFDQNSYKVSGGLHGVGVSVVNALSDKLQLTIRRQGKVWQQTYVDGGKPVAPLKAIGDTDETGTEIRFWPSPEIFAIKEFNYNTLEKRLRELSFLNSNVSIHLEDEISGQKELFHYQGGINSYIEYLNKGKTHLNKKIIYCSAFNQDTGINVEVAVQYIEGYHENIYCFTNNIPQKDGGTHKDGFKYGIKKALSNYMEANGLLNKNLKSKKTEEKLEFKSEDCLKGITAIISVKVPDPKFSSQTKDKLVSSEVSKVVNAIVSEKIEDFLNENPIEAKALAEKIRAEIEIRIKTREIRENEKKVNQAKSNGKLTRCNSKNPAECEIYIVEGDSAGGSAKSGRDAYTQAILPLRGKILNVEKARFDKVIGSETIASLISALECGIQDDFDASKCRYHNIVIMTDADVDGAHIRILLLTFFYRQMPELIERGYVYIAQPPLYKYKKNKEQKYILDAYEKNKYETELALKNVTLFTKPNSEAVDNEWLKDVFMSYANLYSIYKRLDVRIPELITKNLVFAEKLSFEQMSNQEQVKNWAEKFVKILDRKTDLGISFSYDINFNAEKQAYYPEIVMLHFGVKKHYALNCEFFIGNDYAKIMDVRAKIGESISLESYVMINSVQIGVKDFGELYDVLLKEGLKGVEVQRYKGLGEMDAKQLYETTMDPQNRVFLKVSIEDAQEANQMFIDLMGEEVDPRKVFIVENAHLAELDV